MIFCCNIIQKKHPQDLLLFNLVNSLTSFQHISLSFHDPINSKCIQLSPYLDIHIYIFFYPFQYKIGCEHISKMKYSVKYCNFSYGTCRGQYVQSLEAISARAWVPSTFRQTTLAAGQHGRWRHDSGRGHFTHPFVEFLDLLLLRGLESLHLHHMSEKEGEGQEVNNKTEVLKLENNVNRLSKYTRY